MGGFRNVFAIAFTCLLVSGQVLSEEYYFHGDVSNKWEDVNNWTPSYPGSFISEGDVVIVQTDCHFALDVLHVFGGLSVETGARLTIEEKSTLQNDGICNIHGELVITSSATFNSTLQTTVSSSGMLQINSDATVEAGWLDNHGLVNIGFAGSLHIESSATLNHEISGQLENTGRMQNDGTLNVFGSNCKNNQSFYNFGSVYVSGEMHNAGNFNNGGFVTLSGNFLNVAGSEFLNSYIVDILPSGTYTSTSLVENYSNASILLSGIYENNAGASLFNEGLLQSYAMSELRNIGGAFSNHGLLLNGGLFKNDGTFTCEESVYNGAVIQNHSSFTMQPGSTLRLAPESYFQNNPGGYVDIGSQ